MSVERWDFVLTSLRCSLFVARSGELILYPLSFFQWFCVPEILFWWSSWNQSINLLVETLTKTTTRNSLIQKPNRSQQQNFLFSVSSTLNFAIYFKFQRTTREIQFRFVSFHFLWKTHTNEFRLSVLQKKTNSRNCQFKYKIKSRFGEDKQNSFCCYLMESNVIGLFTEATTTNKETIFSY